ncbi:hypothetical protein OHV05_35160 (plasmid) [Kitasatospora sp. NBC_00070]|uniref:hypothetical protein n=1 Tax=Kitasatospora sp. NBC_00070 TaxID=2975962 RepID=UPI002F90DEA5
MSTHNHHHRDHSPAHNHNHTAGHQGRGKKWRQRTTAVAVTASFGTAAFTGLTATSAHADGQTRMVTVNAPIGGNAPVLNNFKTDGTISTASADAPPGGIKYALAMDLSGNSYSIGYHDETATPTPPPSQDIYKISPTGERTLFWHNSSGLMQVATDKSGNVYTTAPAGIAGSQDASIVKISPDGSSSVVAKGPEVSGYIGGSLNGHEVGFMSNPHIYGLGVDGAGNVYFNDTYSGSYRVWKVTPGVTAAYNAPVMIGQYTSDIGTCYDPTFCIYKKNPSEMAVDLDGNVYVEANVTGSLTTTIYTFPAGGNGQPVTVTSSVPGKAYGIAADQSGVYAVAGTGELKKFTKNTWSMSTIPNPVQGAAQAVAVAPREVSDKTWSGGTSFASNTSYVNGLGNRLSMQADGNLVLTDSTGQSTWASNTQGNPGASAVFGTDGTLSIKKADGTPLRRTYGGQPGSTLAFTPTGEVKITKDGATKWSTTTNQMPLDPASLPAYQAGGISFTSNGSPATITAGNSYHVGTGQPSEPALTSLRMQADGNLATYLLNSDFSTGSLRWSSGTGGNPGAYAQFGLDGNLRIISQNGKELLRTYGGEPGSTLDLTAQGYLKISKDGATKWSVGNGDQLYLDPATLPNYKATGIATGTNLVVNTKYYMGTNDANGNKTTYLVLQSDGNLVEYAANPDGSYAGALWASNTSGNFSGYTLSGKFDTDGVIKLTKTPNGGSPIEIWRSNGDTATSGALKFSRDGVTITRASGNPAWSTSTNLGTELRLNAGESVTTGNTNDLTGRKLTMQGDGNLTLTRTSDGKALWATNTWGNSGQGYYAKFDNGTLKVLKSDGTPATNQNTNQNAVTASAGTGGTLNLQNDGNLTGKQAGGTQAWETHTQNAYKFTSPTTGDATLGAAFTVTTTGFNNETPTFSQTNDGGSDVTVTLTNNNNGTATIYVHGVSSPEHPTDSTGNVHINVNAQNPSLWDTQPITLSFTYR